ncbi:two-partner secretion domain-containing protein [Acaryochloris marina NIES-2412]|uniref:two-partner secretion domain-containing protein n=1 Tax=Acaryochloris marina TaxID=155978 RepID=UPI00405A45E4
MFRLKTSIAIFIAILLRQSHANAQITPDKTLPINSQISSDNLTTIINGGTEVGSNLFHSFRNFSISTGKTAFFRNSINIKSIFSRVTGTSVSNIDGILRANRGTNIFLMNPNGIIFGPNSQLNLGGSLVATSANRIIFFDGKKFETENVADKSLLSISQPVGLNLDSSSGPIRVYGNGHNLKFINPENRIGSPIADTSLIANSLQTAPDRTLALIGRSIQIDGGKISTPSGKLVLSSIDKGYVGISSISKGFLFDHGNVIQFSDIALTNQSLLSSTGLAPGDINIKGRNFNIVDRSIIINSNYSSNNIGKISLDLSGDLLIKGINNQSSLINRPPSSVPFGGIITQNFSKKEGSNISILSKNLVLSDFGFINTYNYASGSGGDINISTHKSLSISGKPPIAFAFLPSSVTTLTTLGNAGDVLVNGKSLKITDGGYISSSAVNSDPTSFGNTGKIKLDFDNVTISGGFPVKFSSDSPISFVPSFIGTTSASSGNAGDIYLNANQLYLLDGARINSTANNLGNAGDITIGVKDTIFIKGSLPGSSDPRRKSKIISSAETGGSFFSDLFGLPDLPSGKSGSVNISSNSLVVENEGQITVNNDGTNDAGEIVINSRYITLNNGKISATTNGGDGGNVILNASFVLLKDALLSASALKLGKGGNISADANLFLALGESSLTAEAEKGQGGNIIIAAKAVLLGPDVDVSVSSDAGLQASGTFRVVVEETDLDETTAPTPDVVITPKISSVCNSSGISEFVVLGAGGLQKDPQSQLSGVLSWKVESSDFTTTTSKVELLPKASLVEAKGWRRLEDGKVKLTATPQDSSSKVAAHPTPCTQPLKKANSEPSA